jgi:hypothetical protein
VDYQQKRIDPVKESPEYQRLQELVSERKKELEGLTDRNKRVAQKADLSRDRAYAIVEFEIPSHRDSMARDSFVIAEGANEASASL